METLELKNDFIALCDLLKITGLCQTGGQAKIMISEGQVFVDGEVELAKRKKIKSGQVVEFDNQKVQVVKRSSENDS